MQNIGPDMDDLFRKASENYSLKTGKDRWEEISANLKNSSSPRKENKNGYKKYFAIAIFLFAFLFLADILLKKNQGVVLNLQQLEINKSDNIHNGTTPAPNDKLNFEKPIKEVKSNKSTNIIVSSLHPDILNKSPNSKPYLSKKAASLEYTAVKQEDLIIESKTRNKEAVENFDQTNIPFIQTEIRNRALVELPVISPLKNKQKNNTSRRMYYGLVVGSSIITIRDQQAGKAGFEVGAIGGYRFNNHFSIESGLLFANKYYQTSGEYFSLKKVGSSMPAGSKIMEVKSSSKIIQIPLHFRYDVFNARTHRLFLSSGISSYVLTREQNSYHILFNGTENMMYASYKKSHRYIAGSFDLSIGYEKDIGKKASLRIAPYLHLPLRGIGVGELQLKSTGLRFALTRLAK
jgi:hypothetical protein